MKNFIIFSLILFSGTLQSVYADQVTPVPSPSPSCTDATYSIGGVEYTLSSLDLCQNPMGNPVITGDTETLLITLGTFSQNAFHVTLPISPSIILTDQLPSNCSFIPTGNLPNGLAVENVACSNSAPESMTTYLVPAIFAQLDTHTRALLWIHEYLQYLYPNQAWELKTDITKAFDLVETGLQARENGNPVTFSSAQLTLLNTGAQWMHTFFGISGSTTFYPEGGFVFATGKNNIATTPAHLSWGMGDGLVFPTFQEDANFPQLTGNVFLSNSIILIRYYNGTPKFDGNNLVISDSTIIYNTDSLNLINSTIKASQAITPLSGSGIQISNSNAENISGANIKIQNSQVFGISGDTITLDEDDLSTGLVASNIHITGSTIQNSVVGSDDAPIRNAVITRCSMNYSVLNGSNISFSDSQMDQSTIDGSNLILSNIQMENGSEIENFNNLTAANVSLQRASLNKVSGAPDLPTHFEQISFIQSVLPPSFDDDESGERSALNFFIYPGITLQNFAASSGTPKVLVNPDPDDEDTPLIGMTFGAPNSTSTLDGQNQSYCFQKPETIVESSLQGLKGVCK